MDQLMQPAVRRLATDRRWRKPKRERTGWGSWPGRLRDRLHYDDGVQRLDENGQPVALIKVFPREQAEIFDNWDTLGMRGTGSHDVNVDDLFAPAERAVPLKPLEQPSPAYSGPWHRLTMWPSVACAAIPALGIAQAAIDEFAELATKKTPAFTTTMLKDGSRAAG